MDALATALYQAETTDAVGGAVADAVQRRIGMSAFSMLSCFGPVIAPSDLYALNSRVAPSRVQATIPEILPLIERELEPFASALQPLQKSYDIAERFPQDVVRRSEVFNTVWRPFAVERQLVGYLTTPRDLLGFICVARSSREAAFTASDLRAFEDIRSTVEQALTAARRLGDDLWGALAVLSEATLEPWFLFEPCGRLLWLTDEARARLSLDAMRVGSAIALRHSAALERLRAWVRRHARARDESSARALPACQGAVQGEQFVMRRFEVRPGKVLLLVGFAGPPPPTPAESHPAEKDGELRTARLSRQYSLTPRQARVLSHLAWGKSNKAIAALLGCTDATVEFHVTAVLAKLGCGSRAEAVARFWTA